MSLPHTLDGGPQRSGRFTVTAVSSQQLLSQPAAPPPAAAPPALPAQQLPFQPAAGAQAALQAALQPPLPGVLPPQQGPLPPQQQPGESDVDEAEHGSADASAAAGVERAEPNSRIESLHKLQAILEAQHDMFTKTWEDMKEQVYRALLQKEGASAPAQQATRPNTPTSTYSTSSGRTPPGHSAEASRGPGGGAASSASSVAPPVQVGDARESTLQMWSHLGSTLREVVQRNEQLEEENRHLRLNLAKLTQRVAEARSSILPEEEVGRGLPPRLPNEKAGRRHFVKDAAEANIRRLGDSSSAASVTMPSDGEDSNLAE